MVFGAPDATCSSRTRGPISVWVSARESLNYEPKHRETRNGAGDAESLACQRENCSQPRLRLRKGVAATTGKII